MVYSNSFDMESMPQTVPSAGGFSLSFDYSPFAFDLSLLPEDHDALGSQNCLLKPPQIKEEACSPRPASPSTYPSPPYPGLCGQLSPNYSCSDASPGYPTSPYYVPQSPQSAQFYPTSPEPVKQPVKREKSLDLLAILQESRLLAESLGYKEDSTDYTVPCTPPRTEEDIYNSLDADFFAKKEESPSSNPLLKEILFKEEPISSPLAQPHEFENSPLRELLFKGTIEHNQRLQQTNSPDICDVDNNGRFTGQQQQEQTTHHHHHHHHQQQQLQQQEQQKLQEAASIREDALFKEHSKNDHQLLREVLRDTSFQRKYNLRPVDLGGVGTGFVEDMEDSECVGDLAREQIEPVLSLAMQQLQKDFDNTCVALGIHPEPRRWSAADVAAWVQWSRRQLQLPSVSLESFNIDGATLAALTEEDFCQRAPQCGSMLFAQLEIWKAAVEESPRNTLAASWSPPGGVSAPSNSSAAPSTAAGNPVAASGSGGRGGGNGGGGNSSCTIDYSDDEEEEQPSPVQTGGGKIRNGGSHIHLWQFLKELLQSPGIHGSCIRWLDRSKGVFKIEDSVRVARLWGKRKNRPAMNYDKLSRSIRQYYKKGIMKKTERSQRLVYQFCHPYCL